MTKDKSNQQNAQLSTGPKTPAGKAIVSKNALKHGAYSQAVTITGEDPEAYQYLQVGMMESLNPIGLLEERLVDRLSSLFWRMDRVAKAEREGLILSHTYATAKDRNEVPTFAAMANSGIADRIERLQRYEGQLERSFFRVLHELERIQARRKGEPVNPPVVAEVNVHGAEPAN